MSPSIVDSVLDLVVISLLLTSSVQEVITVAEVGSGCDGTVAN
ncbi:11203_t:CDS:2 [Acaulospora morrowiae]|uniref:11203_t:CDS:1 n=1 Tax=Acaulospora morrowiae TaxID=94023 RepID=A0A9N9AA83_9GLOM|nr:11203_t:CDS:2 [Acaulospora morrowiae]